MTKAPESIAGLVWVEASFWTYGVIPAKAWIQYSAVTPVFAGLRVDDKSVFN